MANNSTQLPRRAIDRVVGPVQALMHEPVMGGVALLVATVVALGLANSPWGEGVHHFWEMQITLAVGAFVFEHPLHHLINDGLMVIFFFYVGLEVKREIVLGELRGLKRAALPIAAAVGGMIVPAGIYIALRHGGEGSHGWGIPMATDIAFVIGCMAVLGKRVPYGLQVILLSLAIVDDIGAILVIAVGYTAKIHFAWLGVAAIVLAVVWLLGAVGVRSVLVYVILGVVVWYAFFESGVHATISGVILGLMTPALPLLKREQARAILVDAPSMLLEGVEGAPAASAVMTHQWVTGEMISPLEGLMTALHPWVTFAIMPIFALANAGVEVHASELVHPVAVAIMLGLVIGKPVGIFVVSFLAVKSGLAAMPKGVTWAQLFGGGILAGIGFTMALFIAGLALKGELLDTAKVGVLGASLLAGVGGIGVLMVVGGESPTTRPVERAG